MAEPNIEGLLTPEEFEHVLRLKTYIKKIQDAIDTANYQASISGLRRPDKEPLRKIERWPCALLANDLSMVIFAHDAAEKRLQVSALEAVEGMTV